MLGVSYTVGISQVVFFTSIPTFYTIPPTTVLGVLWHNYIMGKKWLVRICWHAAMTATTMVSCRNTYYIRARRTRKHGTARARARDDIIKTGFVFFIPILFLKLPLSLRQYAPHTRTPKIRWTGEHLLSYPSAPSHARSILLSPSSVVLYTTWIFPRRCLCFPNASRIVLQHHTNVAVADRPRDNNNYSVYFTAGSRSFRFTVVVVVVVITGLSVMMSGFMYTPCAYYQYNTITSILHI